MTRELQHRENVLRRTNHSRRGLSRRGLIGGLMGGAGLAMLGGSMVEGQSSPVVSHGDCSNLEGLQLLIDWFARRVVLSPEELRPARDAALF